MQATGEVPLAREQRRLAAILATDVVGFSRLVGRDEIGTLARWKERRRVLIDPKITEHGGRIVTTTGDGMLIEFASAVDATRCAVEVQGEMARRNAEALPDQRLEVRMGIHVGDVIIDGDDILGDGVNIASRLEGIADPSGVTVSRAVYEQIRDRIEVTFDYKGEIELKNIMRPVHVFALAGSNAPASPNDATPTLPLPDRLSIAVLPFDNMSGDREQEYFVDGLVEDIIAALSRIPSFFVIARNSSFTYKGRSVDVRQIGRELGVCYVLEGSVRKAGNRLRITGELIDATTGDHIWGDRYDGGLEDVFELQDQITSNVVSIIEPKIQQAEIARAQTKPTATLNAYDLYLQAFAHFSELNMESHGRALTLLERAVGIDRNFSTAYGLMANIHWQNKIRNWGAAAEAEVRGLQAAMRAVELGRDNPVALARGGLGLIHCGGDREDGLRHIERALTLNPNSLLAWRFGGWARWMLGDHERSIKYFQQAMRLSPRDPFAWDSCTGIAFAYFFSGRNEEASTWVDKALLQRPGYVLALRLKVAVSAMAGGPAEDVEAALRRLRASEPELSVSAIMTRFIRCQPSDRDLFELALRKAGMPE
jgi:TolB-like protein/class 3 adenylate cyclase